MKEIMSSEPRNTIDLPDKRPASVERRLRFNTRLYGIVFIVLATIVLCFLFFGGNLWRY